MLPGDPAMYKLPPNFTPEEYASEVRRLGLDQPIIVQFFVYMFDLFTGNWGYSLTVHRSKEVWTLIGEFLPRFFTTVVRSNVDYYVFSYIFRSKSWKIHGN